MMENFSFPRYLSSKRSVDDRALNRAVWDGLVNRLIGMGSRPVRILDIGAGTGSMFYRLLAAGLLHEGTYQAVDNQLENATAFWEELRVWAAGARCPLEFSDGIARLTLPGGMMQVRFDCVDLEDILYPAQFEPARDVVIANAFLDLVDIPAVLARLLPLVEPGGLFLFSINFDGLTIFEPVIDPVLDAQITRLYHATMDERLVNGRAGGDSQAGRHLFTHLRGAGYEIVEAGSSDWVVFARAGAYAADEAYFLHAILHFVEESLSARTELGAGHLQSWLAERRAQIDRGELVYIAHQLDFLAGRPLV